jgi:hypothetical protein
LGLSSLRVACCLTKISKHLLSKTLQNFTLTLHNVRVFPIVFDDYTIIILL